MGQYKVPQDVESEDKIIGPLTFKQFIYALIGFGWMIVTFATLNKLPVVMIVVGAPPAVLFMLLAFYRRDGQDFEQLLIAMVGFWGNSRKRLWRKDELVETYHIEPHPVVQEQTQRDPAQVRGELERLATMIDSRGWNQSGVAASGTSSQYGYASDALVSPMADMSPSVLAQPHASEDIFDLQHSPLAQNLAVLIDTAAKDVREEAIDQMKARVQTAEQRQAVERQAAAQAAAAAAAPAAVAGVPLTPAIVSAQSISGVTSANPNDILKLATERDDLTVSQIAANAARIAPLQEGQSVDLRTNG